jgi:hypothetical protein
VRQDGDGKKKCIHNGESQIQPQFREESDISYVTLVGTMALGGRSFLPLLVRRTSDIKLKSRRLRGLKNSFSVTTILRAYISSEEWRITSMLFCVLTAYNCLSSPEIEIFPSGEFWTITVLTVEKN